MRLVRPILVTLLGVSLPSVAGLAPKGDPSPEPCQLKAPTSEPRDVGKWLPSRPFGRTDLDAIVAIHAHLLPDGRVLAFERNSPRDAAPGSGHGEAGVGDKMETKAMIWDPIGNTFKPLTLPEFNIFCSGHAFLPDGRLLLAGGHVDSTIGTNTLFLFDGWGGRDEFSRGDCMNAARWYPSAITLRGGDVLVLGGTIDDKFNRNQYPQVYEIATGKWRTLRSFKDYRFPDEACSYWYPMTFMAPQGWIFVAGPQGDTWYLSASGDGLQKKGPARKVRNREAGSAVQYAPHEILLIGGGGNDGCTATEGPTATTERIDLLGAPPTWRPGCSMAYARRQMNATILPDGKVLAIGGTAAFGFNDAKGAVKVAEMWDPVKDTWTQMAAMQEARIYHSISLLLPDGRVLVAGGGQPPGGPPDQDHRTMEIYEPPYLHRGARPVLGSAPAIVAFNQVFPVRTPDPAHVKWVTWLRLGSVTHAFDQSQTFEKREPSIRNGELTVTAPSNESASPGPYLLFLLNDAGVPSIGKVVFIH